MYTAQRWTGAITFFYIVWHTWHLRFSGTHLLTFPDLAFGKVSGRFQLRAVFPISATRRS